MNNCSQCGAPFSRLDPACSFCRAPNRAHEALSPEVAGLVTRGQQAFKERRPGDALQFLAKAIEIEPEAFDAYFTLAASWQALGKLDRAR
jgi:Tfp pilus assembly protein PilF